MTDRRGRTATAADRVFGRSPREPASTSPFWPSEVWADEARPPPREWLLDEWLGCGSGGLLAGEGATGKSLLGQQLCTCVSLAMPFLGIPTTMANAIYVTVEDGEDELWRRQIAINAALGIPMSALGEGLTLYSLKGRTDTLLATMTETGGMEPTDLFDEIADLGGRLIVLDNAAHMFPGNEIVRSQVATFCNMLDRLAMRTNGVALLLAHTAKTQGSEYSGSTGWDAHVRQRLFLKHDDKGDLDERVLTRPKVNYARRGAELLFRWNDGAFVRDEDLGDADRIELAAVKRATADNAVFLTCLAEMTRQHRNVSEKGGRNYAPLIFSRMAEARGVTKDRLQDAMDRLFRIEAIERAELWTGADRKPVYGLREVAGNACGNAA